MPDEQEALEQQMELEKQAPVVSFDTEPAIPDVDFEDISDTLTEEERDALAELDELGEEGELEQARAAATEEGEEGEQGDEDPDPRLVAQPEAEPPAATPETPADPPAPAESGPTTDALEAAQAALGAPPEWTEAQANRLREIGDRKALLDRFDDGELTREELDAQLEERETLAAAERAADKWYDQAEAIGTKLWEHARLDFAARHPTLFAGFEDGASEEAVKVSRTFDDIVQRFTASELATGLSFSAALEESRLIMARRHPDLMPSEAPKPTPTPKPGPKAADPRGKPRPDPRPAPPITLAKAPATDADGGAEGDAFASVNRIAAEDPARLEGIVGRMTPEQEDAWLAQTDHQRAGRRR